MRACLLLLFMMLAGGRAWAYPSYISFGYHSCISCHYNPMGGGPLTDYGKSVGATEITDRGLFSQQLASDDERLANMSGFLFQKPGNDWLRPSASFRELYFQENPGKSNSRTRFVTMDASASLALKFLENDKLIFVGNIGYAPTPRQEAASGKKYQNFRSREYYIGYRATQSFGVYAGLMDKTFGIRVPDHIAYSRSVTRLNQNDQTTALLLHYLGETWEFALQPFMGNMVQESRLRERGASLQIGAMVTENTRLGVSALSAKSEYIKRAMYSIDARSGFSPGQNLLFEVGQVDSTPVGAKTTTSRYGFLQNQWLLRRGLSTLMTAEFQQPDVKRNGELYRFGPGIQYFPIYRMELRADLYNTRERSSAAYSDDWWMVTGQVHLWF